MAAANSTNNGEGVKQIGMVVDQPEDNSVVGRVFEYRVDFMDELGRGGFGTVYKGCDQSNNIRAIKKVSKMNKRGTSKEAVRLHYMKEHVHHRNIVEVYDVKSWKDSMWIIMEYCDMGDLNDFFKNYHGLVQDTKSKIKLMLQIATGIEFLHSSNIVHRDIKPGNILLILQPDRQVVLKLGDFGLSKFLDPDAETSSMSSDVGTLAFKAPEFWVRQTPDERVSYRRSVDVFAAGLTFTAMLQAIRGMSLTPWAEGSLGPSEARMPIGLAAQSRRVNHQSAVTVVVDLPGDNMLLKHVKETIRGMTRLAPEDRLTAGTVHARLTEMFNKTVLTPCFSLDAQELYHTMTYINGQLVVPALTQYTPLTDSVSYVFRVHSSNSSNLQEQWHRSCTHPFERGSLATFSALDREHLVDGCSDCGLIRMYSKTARIATTVFSGIAPDVICRGPQGTIFVFSRDCKRILQLQYNGSEFVQIHHLGPFNDDPVVAMCYSPHCDVITVIFDNMTTIKGILVSNRQTAWQHREDQSTSLPYVSDVTNLSDGRICVSSGNSVFALDPTDGRVLETLLDDEDLGGVWEVVGCHGKVALGHGDGSPGNRRITCYNMTSQHETDPTQYAVYIPE